MIKGAESVERRLVYDLEKISAFNSIPDSSDSAGGQITNKTALSGETFYVADAILKSKNISTLTGQFRGEISDLSSDTIKTINRAITLKIPQREKDNLIKERNQLVEKEFKVGLGDKENRRLTYVRWQLDRIDDAESGEFLDYLERMTDTHEKFAKELQGLMNQVGMIKSRPTKPRRR